MSPRTLFEKVWSRHVVTRRDDGYTLLYIDRQLLHDGSGPAFDKLRQHGLKVRRPDRMLAVPDHYLPTGPAGLAGPDPALRHWVRVLAENARTNGIELFDAGDPRQGIVHVVGPEQGVTLPGLTIVCGDSHTSTHGALGALAFGIGYSEIAHVLATQTLWQRKPRAMRVRAEGRLRPGVSAKDLVLAIIGGIGAGGADGHVVEYAGPAIAGLSMEGRLTVCNMSIEAGARAGMIAPDDTTFAYLAERPRAPKGAAWERALAEWRELRSDDGAAFDREFVLDAGEVAPMVTWGTSPEDVVPVTGRVPDPASFAEPAKREAAARALAYQGLVPGTALEGLEVDRVFIGSCTNSRIEDLRMAAAIVDGRKVAIPGWVVPGSMAVKRQAEAEGLDRVFRAAGLEWREPGCSMCVGMNGETGRPGERIASTTNRNFAGRQGRGVRTHLVSPAMAAAAAIHGRFVDVRRLAAGAAA